MKRIVLNIEKNKYHFFLELLKNFDFIQIEEDSDDSKEAIISNLTEGLKELNCYKVGKLCTTSAIDFLDEL